ncbi:hypothetical protein JCM17844_28680 [Iodidimonas gelatinilytica]|uniref:Uncharacterized protein n=1 Tax=Iodidimonas gelatinilytica TaxID=1236966 RepID=A0A5A7MTE8_9PROT|nr:hypothetical protein JCM17844_28680 [Iodidimonas gelatinilytica]
MMAERCKEIGRCPDRDSHKKRVSVQSSRFRDAKNDGRKNEYGGDVIEHGSQPHADQQGQTKQKLGRGVSGHGQYEMGNDRCRPGAIERSADRD